jgi:hypothetical protein
MCNTPERLNDFAIWVPNGGYLYIVMSVSERHILDMLIHAMIYGNFSF